MHTHRRDLLQRSSQFSARLLRFTASERRRGVIPHSLLQQALRAGTAIGAHTAEADSAMTRRHLIALRAGALREAREVVYWLGLIHQSGLCAQGSDVSWLLSEANELVAILSTSIKRLRELP
jgi:four helix bundle protein